MADAAYTAFNKPAREFTGNFLIDDNFLAENGVTDFEQYRVDAGKNWRRTSSCRRNCAAEGREHRGRVPLTVTTPAGRPLAAYASQRLRRL